MEEETYTRKGLRWWSVGWRVALAFFIPLCVYAYVDISSNTITGDTPEEVAMNFAVSQLDRTADDFGWDTKLLGPPNLEPDGKGGYEVTWGYSEGEKSVKVIVFIPKGHWTEIGFVGDTDLLKPKPLPGELRLKGASLVKRQIRL